MSAEVEDLTVEYTDEETGEVVIKECRHQGIEQGSPFEGRLADRDVLLPGP